MVSIREQVERQLMYNCQDYIMQQVGRTHWPLHDGILVRLEDVLNASFSLTSNHLQEEVVHDL